MQDFIVYGLAWFMLFWFVGVVALGLGLEDFIEDWKSARESRRNANTL